MSEGTTTSERQRRKWDAFYGDIARLQDRTLELVGDDLGADLYELLGDVLVEAESIAPPGWSPTDIGLLPRSG